jgi:hypothetical protein
VAGSEKQFEHFCRSQCFVQTAIPLMMKEPPHDLPWVLDRAYEACTRHSVEIVMIDPWNELDRAKPRDMLMTDYIGECLMLVKQFCRSVNAIVVIVAHPTKAIASERRPRGEPGRYRRLDELVQQVRQRPDRGARKRHQRRQGHQRQGPRDRRRQGRLVPFMVDPLTGQFTPQYGSDTDVQ